MATPASAVEWDFPPGANTDDVTKVSPVVFTTNKQECPTPESPPENFEAWLNTDDIEVRGFLDPSAHSSWSFARRIAQVICATKAGADVSMGFFFARAIGTSVLDAKGRTVSDGSRPESDPEQIWAALQWVAENRGLNSLGLVLEHGSTVGGALDKVKRRMQKIADANQWYKPGFTYQLVRCNNGCFNVIYKGKFWWSLSHEKYIAISDTIWESGGPHPVVITSSGNIARSQMRSYLQDASVIYDDTNLYNAVHTRYRQMAKCGWSGGRAACKYSNPGGLTKQRGIWVDPTKKHYGKGGTWIGFSPQPTTTKDYFVEAFDGVDCAVDNRIRIAVFKMSIAASGRVLGALKKLKSAGCDVKILLSKGYGSTDFPSAVRRALNNSGLSYKCSVFPMHTKLILIGPAYENAGKILTGTANLASAGMYYNEDHTVVVDTRRAANEDPEYAESARRVFGEYMAQWDKLSQGSSKSLCK